MLAYISTRAADTDRQLVSYPRTHRANPAAMALSQDVGQKRKRFTATDITPSKNNGTGDADSSELTAIIRKWGSAFTVFEDTDRDTPLWQLQICHGGRNSFGYQVLAVAREALQKHPNSNVRDLQQLESVLQVRLLNGAPPQSGPLDPDGTGLDAWQVVLYSTSLTNALDFIQVVLKHKVAKGHLLQPPSLHAACPDGTVDTVPQPWKLVHPPLHGPKAFAALPPKGRRHILCQIELRQAATKTANSQESGQGEDANMDVGAEDNAESIYSVSIFGGIYPYRELFDAANVPGGHIQLPDGNRDYVRFVEVQDDDPGRSKLKSIFEQVLLNVPVYLVDSTQTANDELVSWTCSLSSVHLGETVS